MTRDTFEDSFYAKTVSSSRCIRGIVFVPNVAHAGLDNKAYQNRMYQVSGNRRTRKAFETNGCCCGTHFSRST